MVAKQKRNSPKNGVDRRKASMYIGQIIDALQDPYTGRGGPARLAKELGITPQGVYAITMNNWCPERHVEKLVALADRLKVRHTNNRPLIAWDFRPDKFDPEGAAL